MMPRQNGRHFPDDIFKWMSLNENAGVTVKILLNFGSSEGSNEHYSSIGSDNGSASTRRQVIIWTYDALFIN